jgi:hypothetical protein
MIETKMIDYMESLALQEYISALVDERKAGLCGCELMYLQTLVNDSPTLDRQLRQFRAVKLMLANRKISTPCPQRLARRIHRELRQMYLLRYRAFE